MTKIDELNVMLNDMGYSLTDEVEAALEVLGQEVNALGRMKDPQEARVRAEHILQKMKILYDVAKSIVNDKDVSLFGSPNNDITSDGSASDNINGAPDTDTPGDTPANALSNTPTITISYAADDPEMAALMEKEFSVRNFRDVADKTGRALSRVMSQLCRLRIALSDRGYSLYHPDISREEAEEEAQRLYPALAPLYGYLDTLLQWKEVHVAGSSSSSSSVPSSVNAPFAARSAETETPTEVSEMSRPSESSADTMSEGDYAARVRRAFARLRDMLRRGQGRYTVDNDEGLFISVWQESGTLSCYPLLRPVPLRGGGELQALVHLEAMRGDEKHTLWLQIDVGRERPEIHTYRVASFGVITELVDNVITWEHMTWREDRASRIINDTIHELQQRPVVAQLEGWLTLKAAHDGHVRVHISSLPLYEE